MAERPAVNSNVDDIADRAKHGYAVGTRLLPTVPVEVSQSGRTTH